MKKLLMIFALIICFGISANAYTISATLCNKYGESFQLSFYFFITLILIFGRWTTLGKIQQPHSITRFTFSMPFISIVPDEGAVRFVFKYFLLIVVFFYIFHAISDKILLIYYLKSIFLSNLLYF